MDGWMGWDISQTTRNTRAPGGVKKAPVTPNQTKLLEPKKTRKRKGKEEDKESIGAKKEKIIGAREEINPRNVGAKKIRQCVQKLNLL